MPETPPLSALTVLQRSALVALAEGGVIERRRTFPFPPSYQLRKADGTTATIAERTIAKLAEHGLLAPHYRDSLWDNIDWTLSERGAALANAALQHTAARATAAARASARGR